MPPPSSAEAVGWVVLSIAAACLALNQIAGFYFTLSPRKTPPDHETYATKAELAQAKKEHQESDARIERRFEEWMEQQQEQHKENIAKLEEAMDKFGEWQQSIERALGHVETKADVALGKRRS